MYEKLCAILDALQELVISCRAECTYCSGVWEIVCAIPVDNGMKLIRYPLSYDFIKCRNSEYLVSQVLKEVCA